MGCVVAIDQGTTGSTVLVFDRRGAVVGRAYSEFRQHYPRPGWVEHDAEEIWRVTLRVARQALRRAGIGGGAVAALGITNQRAGRPRDRLAGPAHGRALRRAEGRGTRGGRPREDRSRPRPLLLGHEG